MDRRVLFPEKLHWGVVIKIFIYLFISFFKLSNVFVPGTNHSRASQATSRHQNTQIPSSHF